MLIAGNWSFVTMICIIYYAFSMHINVYLRQTIYKMTVWGCNQLTKLISAVEPFNNWLCKAALEMALEHLPDLQLFYKSIQLISAWSVVLMKYWVEVIWVPYQRPGISHFHCSTTTITQAVIPYKCKWVVPDPEP